MRPVVWRPPVEPSAVEQAVIKAVRRAKLFVFLREHRHELFDEQFQAGLAETYVDSPKGQPPVPPARLALATILQAYTGASDDEVIEAAVMDRRWQLVLDCMGAEEPPFSKGTLVGFRKRLIEHNLDRRLIERTVELAARTGGFGARALRAALDSSPLWGAGRVEDTFNLMGHALRKALGVIAVLQGRGQAAGTAVVAAQAGVPQLAASSLKAALDRDWDDPAAREEALAQVLGLLGQVESFVAGYAGDQAAAGAVAVACQVRDQDVDCSGPAPALRRGVARDRRISVEDADVSVFHADPPVAGNTTAQRRRRAGAVRVLITDLAGHRDRPGRGLVTGEQGKRRTQPGPETQRLGQRLLPGSRRVPVPVQRGLQAGGGPLRHPPPAPPPPQFLRPFPACSTAITPSAGRVHQSQM